VKILYIFLIFLKVFVYAEVIDPSLYHTNSLLPKSYIYIGKEKLNQDELKNVFKPFSKEHLNIGVSHKYVWIKLDFYNSSKKDIKKILVFSSPLLEDISLFSQDLTLLKKNGMLYQNDKHSTIAYIFELDFKPYSKSSYYLRVSSKYTPIDFSLYLKDKESFFKKDRDRQFVDILLLGCILAMMLYSLLLSGYLRDKSFFYYGLYLFALIYQQMTYLGITQIYFPSEFIKVEATYTIPKVLFLILTSALFAMHFLEYKKIKKIEVFYKSVIVVLGLEFLFLDPLKEYSLNIVILTGAIFILLNLLCGIYAYKKGVKQARLFILGFGIVFLSYIMIIIDALGLASVMVYFQNILIWATTIEALVLSLAFADRYLILENEKKEIDKKMLEELKYRKKLVLEEVEIKTRQLNGALKEKELLLQEVHHRVKNNLQIILSMIRLQSDLTPFREVKDSFHILENRINAIAKTYSVLLSKDSFDTIDMKEYIDELINDLVEVMGKDKINFKKHIQMKLPIKKAVYIGLILNELITNSFKYAFKDDKGEIEIKLYKSDDENILEISDSGVGFDMDKKDNSLGLRLVKMIVKNQLKGSITMDTSKQTKTIIRFRS